MEGGEKVGSAGKNVLGISRKCRLQRCLVKNKVVDFLGCDDGMLVTATKGKALTSGVHETHTPHYGESI